METLELQVTKKNTETITNQQSYEWKKYDTLNRQIIASISWFLVTTCAGMSFAFTGTLLPLIASNEEDGSWLVATNVFSMVIGAILSTLFTRVIGNKISILICNVISIHGWVCLSMTTNFWLFLLSFFLIGFSAGFGNKVAIAYLIEMPQRELRGIISAFNSTCFTVGQMLGHLAFIVLPWKVASRFCGLVPLSALLLLYFVPELPTWLLAKGKVEDAKRNFLWLRGASQENESEFASMASREKEMAAKRPIFSTIFSKPFLAASLVAVILLTTQSSSGFDCMVIYTVHMLTKISPDINAALVTIMFDAVCLICGIVSCYLVMQLRRRVLILTGAAAAILSLIILILLMHFQWPAPLLIVCLCTFTAAINLAVIPVAWLIPAEIFPEMNRDLGLSVSTIYYYLFTAVLTKFLPSLTNTYGMQVTLSMFTTVFCICTILVFFIVPETKKLTLQELGSEVHKVKFGYRRSKPSRGIETGSR